MNPADFRAWCPEQGETEAEAREILLADIDAEEAAAYYAEHLAGFDDEHFEFITILIRDVETRELHEVDVGVEWSPTFYTNSRETP